MLKWYKNVEKTRAMLRNTVSRASTIFAEETPSSPHRG